jgi:hypothetical protein
VKDLPFVTRYLVMAVSPFLGNGMDEKSQGR